MKGQENKSFYQKVTQDVSTFDKNTRYGQRVLPKMEFNVTQVVSLAEQAGHETSTLQEAVECQASA